MAARNLVELAEATFEEAVRLKGGPIRDAETFRAAFERYEMAVAAIFEAAHNVFAAATTSSRAARADECDPRL